MSSKTKDLSTGTNNSFIKPSIQSNIFLALLITALMMVNVQGHAQVSEIFQTVKIEKFQGKKFTLKAKIYYQDKLKNESFAVLSAFPISDKGKVISNPIYNENAETYYKEGEWSSYELAGKIDKKAAYFGVGVTIGGTDSYYVDDIELYIKDGRNEIAIPITNSGFENDSLGNWQLSRIPEHGSVSPSTNKAFSGNSSLYFDYSKVASSSFGNNREAGKFMEINDVELYYEIYGKGDPLLLIHGNNSSMARLVHQQEFFKNDYKVIGLDSRGQGKSTASRKKLTYELMADDVSKFIKKLGLEKVNIIGWSDGGNIALILAMEHPEQVKNLAIMGTVIYNDKSSVIAGTNKILREQLADMEKKGVSNDDMNYRLKMLLLNEPNIHPDSLEKIEASTLVMAGEHDIVTEQHTELIAENIPKAKLKIFPNAGHEAPEEIPEIFNKTVSEFFLENQ